MTARSRADLLTAYADNIAKAIKPVHHRDFVDSALNCYGSLHIDGGSTALGLTAAPAVISTWTSSGPAGNTTPNLPGGELQADADGIWAVEFSASFLVSVAPDRFLFQLRNNAVLVAGGQRDIDGALAARVGVHVRQLVSLTAGDDLSVYAAAVGAAGDAALEHANLVAHRIG